HPALTRLRLPCLTGGVGEPTGPIDAVLRQLRAVRRRKNLRLAQHAAAVGALFLLGARVAPAGVVVASVALARRIVRDWLAAGAVAPFVDATRALRGRVSSLTEIRDATDGDLYALLLP